MSWDPVLDKPLFEIGDILKVKNFKIRGVVTRVSKVGNNFWYGVHLANGTRTTFSEERLEREGVLEALASCVGEGAF